MATQVQIKIKRNDMLTEITELLADLNGGAPVKLPTFAHDPELLVNAQIKGILLELKRVPKTQMTTQSGVRKYKED